MAAAAAAPNLLVALVAMGLVGATSVAFLSMGNSTLQLAAEPHMRGRVMALWAVAFLGSTPIGGPIAGAVSEQFGGRAGLALGAAACLLAAGLGALACAAGSRPARRRRRADLPQRRRRVDHRSVTDRALVLAHDDVPGRGADEVGSLAPALTELGLDVLVATFLPGGPPIPDPAGAAVLVVLGSAAAADDDSLPWLAPERAYVTRAIELGTPVLGICFGAQLLARELGGTVGRAARSERGFVRLTSTDPARWPTASGCSPRRRLHAATGRRPARGQRDRRAGLSARPPPRRAVPPGDHPDRVRRVGGRVAGDRRARRGGGRRRPARSVRRGGGPRRGGGRGVPGPGAPLLHRTTPLPPAPPVAWVDGPPVPPAWIDGPPVQ